MKHKIAYGGNYQKSIVSIDFVTSLILLTLRHKKEINHFITASLPAHDLKYIDFGIQPNFLQHVESWEYAARDGSNQNRKP